MRFVSLDRWPKTPTKKRMSKYTFKVAYNDTLGDLHHELKKLKGQDPMLQIDIPAHKIRNDGMPHSNAPNPEFPGVILSFTTPQGAMSFACDNYEDWKSNLRAIVLTLEALRSVNRWGAATSGEQYRGYTAIPSNHLDLAMSLSEAQAFVKPYGSYKDAAKALHPDNNDTGSEYAFKRLQEARRVLTEARVEF